MSVTLDVNPETVLMVYKFQDGTTRSIKVKDCTQNPAQLEHLLYAGISRVASQATNMTREEGESTEAFRARKLANRDARITREVIEGMPPAKGGGGSSGLSVEEEAFRNVARATLESVGCSSQVADKAAKGTLDRTEERWQQVARAFIAAKDGIQSVQAVDTARAKNGAPKLQGKLRSQVDEEVKRLQQLQDQAESLDLDL